MSPDEWAPRNQPRPAGSPGGWRFGGDGRRTAVRGGRRSGGAVEPAIRTRAGAEQRPPRLAKVRRQVRARARAYGSTEFRRRSTPIDKHTPETTSQNIRYCLLYYVPISFRLMKIEICADSIRHRIVATIPTITS